MHASATKRRFVMETAETETMMRETGCSSEVDLLPLLVPAAKALARAPISGYRVGAVGLGTSGRIYMGVNLEFPGVPLNNSVHAEQFLLANAASHGEAAIVCIAVSSAPCGHCRQFLQEIRGASEIRILIASNGSGWEDSSRSLADFLPHPFGPPDLLGPEAPRLLELHRNEIGDIVSRSLFESSRDEMICNGIGEEIEERLLKAAAAGARVSHAPYSGCAAGFAVADVEGRVSGGAYLESAAYNPGLGPAAAAMVAHVVAGGGGWDDIVAAALVERDGAVVSHEGTARVLLAAVAPRARLSVYRYAAAVESKEQKS